MLDSWFSQLSLQEVTYRCREETERNREQESGYCFELFRRALETHDQFAWQAIQEQYRGLLLHWLHNTARKQLEPEEAEDLLQNALEKFWRSLSKRTRPVGKDFAHVGALLKYLRQCATTAVLDARRQLRRRERLQQVLMLEAETLRIATGHVAAFEQGQLEEEEQLQKVQAWLRQEVSDELEKMVLKLSYEEALKPADIAARFPHHFAGVQEVRQIKERVLKRARRALLA